MEERISREEIVRIYGIEVNFFDELDSCGLIQTEIIDQVIFAL